MANNFRKTVKKRRQTSIIFISHALLQFKVGIHAREQQCAAVLWNVVCARTPQQTDNRYTNKYIVLAFRTAYKEFPSRKSYNLLGRYLLSSES